MLLQALEATSAAAGSSFGLTAAAAAANVTNALGSLLQRKLTLPCTQDGANPGALCYDGVFKMVTTTRALRVSPAGAWAAVCEGWRMGCCVESEMACAQHSFPARVCEHACVCAQGWRLVARRAIIRGRSHHREAPYSNQFPPQLAYCVMLCHAVPRRAVSCLLPAEL